MALVLLALEGNSVPALLLCFSCLSPSFSRSPEAVLFLRVSENLCLEIFVINNPGWTWVWLLLMVFLRLM